MPVPPALANHLFSPTGRTDPQLLYAERKLDAVFPVFSVDTLVASPHSKGMFQQILIHPFIIAALTLLDRNFPDEPKFRRFFGFLPVLNLVSAFCESRLYAARRTPRKAELACKHNLYAYSVIAWPPWACAVDATPQTTYDATSGCI